MGRRRPRRRGTQPRSTSRRISLSGVDPDGLTPGAYTVSARAIDAAGNWSGIGTTTLTVVAHDAIRCRWRSAQSVETPEDVALPIVLAGNDADIGDVLTFTVGTQPAHGTLTGTAPDLLYTPDADFNGDDSFTFTANDGTDTSDPATVTITITAVNDDPTIATPPTATATEGTTLPIAATVADIDGDTVTVAWTVTNGSNVDTGATCTIADLAATDITCTDDGTYTITATASDDNGGTATAQTELTVTNADPAITITGQPAGPVPQGTPVDITASITDAGTNDTHTCTIDWGDTTTTPGTITADTRHQHLHRHPHLRHPRHQHRHHHHHRRRRSHHHHNHHHHRRARRHREFGAGGGRRRVWRLPRTLHSPIVLEGNDADIGDVLTFTVGTQPAHGTLTGTAPDLRLHTRRRLQR